MNICYTTHSNPNKFGQNRRENMKHRDDGGSVMPILIVLICVAGFFAAASDLITANDQEDHAWEAMHLTDQVANNFTASGCVDILPGGSDPAFSITIRLTDAGSDCQPVVSRAGVSTSTERDYAIVNQVSSLPPKGELVVLNLSCTPEEDDPPPNFFCKLNSWVKSSK
jgi:hypothetical protein